MAVCDVCNVEVGKSAGSLVGAEQFRSMVRNGFRPAPGYIQQFGPREQTDALFVQMAMASDTDWMLCRECAQRATPFLQTTGETGGSEEIKSPDLLARLLAKRTPSQCPPVPKDWRKKPSLLSIALGQAAFGRCLPPWGSFAEARLLIAYGHVAEGRELLYRLTARSEGSPESKTYLMAYCLDGLRPPAGIKPEHLIGSLPPCEREALASLIAWAAGDAQKGPDSLMKSWENEVASDHGAFIVLLAWLAWSDVSLQTQVLYPLGRTVEFGLAVKPSKGHAQLMLRRHEEAWDTFSRGEANPVQTVDIYRKELGVSLDADTERQLTRMIQEYCLTGKALVLYDLCFATEAGRLFGLLPVSGPHAIQRAWGRLSKSG